MWRSSCPCSYREYLAIFKKTVAMHEVFLQRLAAHPTLRLDHNFSVFLEYNQDVSWLSMEGSETRVGESCLIMSPSLPPVWMAFDQGRRYMCPIQASHPPLCLAECSREEQEGGLGRVPEEHHQVCRWSPHHWHIRAQGDPLVVGGDPLIGVGCQATGAPWVLVLPRSWCLDKVFCFQPLGGR